MTGDPAVDDVTITGTPPAYNPGPRTPRTPAPAVQNPDAVVRPTP